MVRGREEAHMTGVAEFQSLTFLTWMAAEAIALEPGDADVEAVVAVPRFVPVLSNRVNVAKKRPDFASSLYTSTEV